MTSTPTVLHTLRVVARLRGLLILVVVLLVGGGGA